MLDGRCHLLVSAHWSDFHQNRFFECHSMPKTYRLSFQDYLNIFCMKHTLKNDSVLSTLICAASDSTEIDGLSDVTYRTAFRHRHRKGQGLGHAYEHI
jgi:hypothetical protein